MLLIKHTWYVTYQDNPIRMAGYFSSLEAFEQRRNQWLLEANVKSVSIDEVSEISLKDAVKAILQNPTQ